MYVIRAHQNFNTFCCGLESSTISNECRVRAPSKQHNIYLVFKQKEKLFQLKH